MKIVIDATESFQPRLTGTGVYARQLIRHLLPLAADDELTVLGIRSAEADTGFMTGSHALRLLRGPRRRSLWSQLRLPLHLLAHRYDLLHVPGHKLPALCPCRSVATILDLAVLKFPETFRPLHRQRLRWFTRNAARRADRLIAISASTKRDLCDEWGVPEGKIDVVHLGVDLNVFRPDGPPEARRAPYILSVGTLQPRKNYVRLVRAFKQICRQRREPVELLIAGQRGWMWEEIEREAKAPPFADRVHLLGFVEDEKLPPLYRGAALVAMPSLYEGFGLPLLEAMACGAPLVASNASCFPEVIGDAGVLLDPKDEEAWAHTLGGLLDDADQRAALRERGLRRAGGFTWEQTARRTLEVYRKTAAS